jgi:hypothetical protein
MRKLIVATIAILVAASPLHAQVKGERPRVDTRAAAEKARADLERQLEDLQALVKRQGMDASRRAQLEALEAALAAQTWSFDLQHLDQFESLKDHWVDQMAHAELNAAELGARMQDFKWDFDPLAFDHWFDAHEFEALQKSVEAHDFETMKHSLEALDFDWTEVAARATQEQALALDALALKRSSLFDTNQEWLEGEEQLRRSLDRLYGPGPRAAVGQDPADSLYRAGREAMNRKDYPQAARLFGRIREESRFARSQYRAESYYWQAFALARVDTEDALRQAQAVLGELVRQYPADRRHSDATAQVRLAQMGNSSAAQKVRTMALEPPGYVAGVAEGVRAAAEAAVAAASDVAWTVPPGVGVRGNGARQRAQCPGDDSEIRLIALNALVRMDTAAAMPVLSDVMARRDACAASLRASALIVVARVRTGESENLLYEAARSDPDLDVRRTALVHLSSRSPDRAVGIVETDLRSAQDARTQEWALSTLSRMRTERAWAAIRDYAANPANSVESRRRAIGALGQSNDSTSTRFLRDLYTRVGNERQLKEAILLSSAFRRSGMDPDWLYAIAQNDGEDARLREYAVTTLGRRRDVSVDRIVNLYDRNTEKRVKSAAVSVLVDRSKTETSAADKLIDIARNESDPDIRKRAIMGLASSNDPRARELLIEILRR